MKIWAKGAPSGCRSFRASVAGARDRICEGIAFPGYLRSEIERTWRILNGEGNLGFLIRAGVPTRDFSDPDIDIDDTNQLRVNALKIFKCVGTLDMRH